MGTACAQCGGTRRGPATCCLATLPSAMASASLQTCWAQPTSSSTTRRRCSATTATNTFLLRPKRWTRILPRRAQVWASHTLEVSRLEFLPQECMESMLQRLTPKQWGVLYPCEYIERCPEHAVYYLSQNQKVLTPTQSKRELGLRKHLTFVQLSFK